MVEHLDTTDAALVIGETGFLKKGRAFCNVERQYTGSSASCR
jgi:SRSO17 transposase